jgi:hypothetical protein
MTIILLMIGQAQGKGVGMSLTFYNSTPVIAGT